MNKTVQKIAVWIMLIVMVLGFVGIVLAYLA